MSAGPLLARPGIGPKRPRSPVEASAIRARPVPARAFHHTIIARPDGRDSVSGSYRVGRRTYRDEARDPGRSTWGRRARGRHGWVRARAPRRAGVRARRAIDAATQRRCAQLGDIYMAMVARRRWCWAMAALCSNVLGVWPLRHLSWAIRFS
jgi:hypothetical protein